MSDDFEHEDSFSSSPYKELLKQIWRDIRRYRPTTPLQKFSFALHIGLLIGVVGPRIIAWGHINNLNGIIRYNVTTDLVPTILLILVELVTVSYCLVLSLVTCKLYNDQTAEMKNPYIALFRLVAYLVLIAILQGVMAAVFRFTHNYALVDAVPYYICFWAAISVFMVGSTFFLGRKKPAIRI